MMKDKKHKSQVLPVLGISFTVLLILIILLPILLKNQIADKALEIANSNVNARIKVKGVSLSIFKSFPDLQFGMTGLQVSGIGRQAGTDLAKIGSISLDLDLKQALKKQIKINSIVIDNPEINAVVLADGSANWDIAKTEKEKTQAVKEEKQPSNSNLSVIMQDFQINNASIRFTDQQSNTSAELDNLNFSLNGDLSAVNSQLNLKTDIEKINFTQAAVKMAKDLNLDFMATIAIDLENMKFTFIENTLSLNELNLGFDGSVQMLPDGSIITDLTFQTEQTDFKTLLSFVPAVFMTGFEDLKTEGNLQFNGFAKGTMIGESLPAFSIDLLVTDAMVQYPDLPGSINNINIDVKVANPGGDADLTTIAVNRFELFMQDNPVSAKFRLATPVSDPDISSQFNLKLDLNTLKDVIPLESMNLSGNIDADMKLNTRLSTIEKEDYSNVDMQGGVTLTNFVFSSADFTRDVTIKKADLKFTPRYVELKQFSAKVANSDLSLSGKIENFIPFALQGKVLKGTLNINSSLIDANQLMTLSSAPETAAPALEAKPAAQVVIIPDNLDLTLKCDLKKIRFDNMEITKLTGNFALKNTIADLSELRFDAMKGGIHISGNYQGYSRQSATTQAKLKLWKIDVNSAFNSFSVLQEMMPVLGYSSGNISGTMNLDARLDQQMQPVLTSINSEGTLQTSDIIIENSPALNDIAANLKNPKFKKVKLSAADVSYTMTNGNLTISPFTTNFSKSSVEISGTVNVDQQMDIKLQTRLAVNDLGDEARKQIDDLVKQINKAGLSVHTPEYLDITAKLEGTVNKPKLVLDWQTSFDAVLKSLQNQVVEAGKDKVKDEAIDLLKGLFK
ncbi:MAG: AsmA family protein [Candidatus Cloacimonetes bacterium]|nr:AsmA family protein [Candidatus Cloacimonadota bacterium]